MAWIRPNQIALKKITACGDDIRDCLDAVTSIRERVYQEALSYELQCIHLTQTAHTRTEAEQAAVLGLMMLKRTELLDRQGTAQMALVQLLHRRGELGTELVRLQMDRAFYIITIPTRRSYQLNMMGIRMEVTPDQGAVFQKLLANDVVGQFFVTLAILFGRQGGAAPQLILYFMLFDPTVAYGIQQNWGGTTVFQRLRTALQERLEK